jgi:uncharacterized protein
VSLAIGVMARAPVPGHCKTRLLAEYDPAWVASLYAALLEDTLAALGTVRAERRTVFLAPDPGAEALLAPLVPAGWDVTLQRGDELGERLVHAFDAMLGGAGIDAALISGSDAPLLPVEPLCDALATLAEDEVLLGPCEDGGYALLAIRTPAPHLFAAMPWSTSSVAAETRARAVARGSRVRELPVTWDVDEPADVERLRIELRRSPERAPAAARLLGAASAAAARIGAGKVEAPRDTPRS